MIDDKYYHRINNIDIAVYRYDNNGSYIQICELGKTSKWGIATFQFDEDNGYWYLRTYGNFNRTSKIDWYDFGCLINLGFRWIEEGVLNGSDNL